MTNMPPLYSFLSSSLRLLKEAIDVAIELRESCPKEIVSDECPKSGTTDFLLLLLNLYPF